MSDGKEHDAESPPPKQQVAAFQTTHWSLVIQAAGENSSAAATALESLCRAYWRPIYYYVRASGLNSVDAQDMTQEFFYTVLEKGYFGQADRNRGRFRTFLKVAVKNFMASEWRKAKRIKRGGQQRFCSLDELEEDRFQIDANGSVSPDSVYDARWARTVFSNTLAKLRNEMKNRGHLDRFELYKQFVLPSESPSIYAAAAKANGLTEQTIKSGVHRFRERVRTFFLKEIAETVENPADAESEAQELMRALARS